MTETAKQHDSLQWKLVITNKIGFNETFPISKTLITIGRELDNDIPLDDLQISRYHARLEQQDAALIVEDLNSENGTLVNGQPLTSPQTLQSGDEIALGSFVLRLQSYTPQSRTVTQVSPVVGAAVAPQRGGGRPILLIIAALLLAVLLLLSGIWLGQRFFPGMAQPAETVVSQPTATVSKPTITISQSPVANSQVPINQSVTVQAIASDPAGVMRMELWVNGRQVDRVESPLDQTAASMTASFQWAASNAGEYVLELRAYSENDQVVVQEVTTITAIGGTDTPTPQPPTATPTLTPVPPTSTPTPSPTATPLPPTPTPVPASLTVQVPALNVRAGPGTQYEVVDRLAQGDTVTIVGQATASQGAWWQIMAAGAPDGRGWVSANPGLVSAQNTANVPLVTAPALPTVPPPTSTPPAPQPTATATATATPIPQVTQAPPGQTLLIVENRSQINQSARLTLSGGKSVGGGREIDPPAGGQVELVLEPDFYRALWSAPWNSFTRGANFTAVPGKVIVMWIVPEDGVTNTEVYDELVVRPPTVTPIPSPTPTPLPAFQGLAAPPGKALFVVSNRSMANEFGLLTITGGNFGGGEEIVLNANTEQRLELQPGQQYRTIWHSPAKGGVNAGREFRVSEGEVVLGWIVPEDGTVFMQFPGQSPIQINN